MRSIYLPVLVALLGMIDFVIAAPGNDAPSVTRRDGGFSTNCMDMSLNNWTLEAYCQISSGSYIHTTLDLKQCLGWGAGGYVLCQPQEADAYQVCKDLSLSGGKTLTASCSNASGGHRTSSVNLDNCVSNNGGQLECPL